MAIAKRVLECYRRQYHHRMRATSHTTASAPSSGPHRRPMLGAVAALAYALWCIGVLWVQPRSPLAILSFLAPCVLFICSWAWRQHRLLGAARTLGAPALSRDAEALQNAARSGTVDPDQAARVLAASVFPPPESGIAAAKVFGKRSSMSQAP